MSRPAIIDQAAIAAVYHSLRAHVVRQPGERIEWGDLYNRMTADWTALCPWTDAPCLSHTLPSAPAFAAALAYICKRTGIAVSLDEGTRKAYCLDLALQPITLPACPTCQHRPAARSSA